MCTQRLEHTAAAGAPTLARTFGGNRRAAIAGGVVVVRVVITQRVGRALVHAALRRGRGRMSSRDSSQVRIVTCSFEGGLVLRVEDGSVAVHILEDTHGLVDVQVFHVRVPSDARRHHPPLVRIDSGRSGDAVRVVHHVLDGHIGHEGADKVGFAERLFARLAHNATMDVDLPPPGVQRLGAVQMPRNTARVAFGLVHAARAHAVAGLKERMTLGEAAATLSLPQKTAPSCELRAVRWAHVVAHAAPRHAGENVVQQQ